jgi:hypothetical protein
MAMYRFVSCRSLLLAATIGLIAFPSRGEEPALREAKIEQALSAPTQLEFVEVPLQDVIDYLKDYHKIEIQIDPRRNELGIDSSAPVSKNLKGMSLRSALRLLLGELKLTYVVCDEVLLITTPERAAQMLSTRVYPFDDLASLAGGPPGPARPALENLIRTTIEPESWYAGGKSGAGTMATISLDGHLALVVRQTYAVHRQITTLLASLRDLTPKPEPAKPKPAPASAR